MATVAAAATVAHGTVKAWVECGRRSEDVIWSTDRKAFTFVGLAAAGYFLVAPIAAVMVNLAFGPSVKWENWAVWLLHLDHRTPTYAARCGLAVCYNGGVDAEGARQLGAATDGVAPRTVLRIRSPGGDIGAMEDIMRTVARHAMPVAIAVDPSKMTDCGSDCVGIFATNPSDTTPAGARLTVHMTREVTFAPGMLGSVSMEACETLIAADCQERVNLALYGRRPRGAAWRHQQASYLAALEGDGPHALSGQLAACRDPDPLEIIEGITFNWGAVMDARQGKPAWLECPKAAGRR